MLAHETTEAPSCTAEQIEEIYHYHVELLRFVAIRKFRIPEADAENLIQEVFLSFLGRIREIRHIRAWLVGAICNASRHYLRSKGRIENLAEEMSYEGTLPGSTSVVDTVATQLTIRQTLDSLPEKNRETLRMRYYEGCSAAEIAQRLKTTPRYAEKLIHVSLKRAHAVYASLMKRP